MSDLPKCTNCHPAGEQGAQSRSALPALVVTCAALMGSGRCRGPMPGSDLYITTIWTHRAGERGKSLPLQYEAHAHVGLLVFHLVGVDAVGTEWKLGAAMERDRAVFGVISLCISTI